MTPTTTWAAGGGPPVVAFGGNALLPDPDQPGAADRNAAEFAAALATLMPEDAGLILVHGNGPQVGTALLRAEAASGEVPTDPLDVLVAETQGSIGYLLSRSIGDAFRALGREVVVAAIVTQVVVDPSDPAMRQPSKPVGPYYERERGEAIAAERGWSLVDVPGRGMRRVVPSPPPIEVIEIDAVAGAAAAGLIVIAGGGGGVPIARSDGAGITGVEAVIDKDRTAALIATAVDARGLVILTDVARVSTGFGTPDERPMPTMSGAQARQYLDAGEFPPGSMGPKVEACVAYARATGRTALITSVAALPDALGGRDGTRITG
jgi:carbamate kinase